MLELKFRDEILRIPKPGRYIISTGCGYGKTTAIKTMINENFNTSLLYSAKTREECNEMYEHCKRVGKEKYTLLLHAETDTYAYYKEHKSEIRDFPIVITTHESLIRISHDKLLFVETNSNASFWNIESTRRVHSSPVIPRQIIIIDEAINIPGNRYAMPKNEFDAKVAYLMSAKDNMPLATFIPDRYMFMRGNFIGYFNCKSDLNELEINPKSNADGGIFTSQILENSKSIIKHRETPDKTHEEIYTPLTEQFEFDKEYNSPYILILDGTGDINYRTSEDYKILKLHPKVTGLSFKTLDINFSRRYESNSELETALENIKLPLIDIVKSHNKTLIITYMNLKGELDLNYYNTIHLEDFKYKEYLNTYLVGYPDKYSIIHFQSGLDKATNRFRDYDCVVFLGKFRINQEGINDHIYYNNLSEFTNLDFTVQYLVQGIFRSRIRNYEGESVDVYFTKDYTEKDKSITYRYITTGENYESVLKYNTDIEILRKGKVDRQLESLMMRNSMIKSYIEKGDFSSGLNLGWWSHKNLQRVFGIIRQGSLVDYIPTLEYLKTFNINIIPYSYRGKYPKVINKYGIVYEINESEVDEYLSNPDWKFYKNVKVL